MTTDYTQTIGSGSYNGETVLTATGPVTTSGSSVSSSTVKQYYKIDSSAKTVTVYGIETATTFPFSFTSVTTFTPPRTDRLNLAAGEFYTQDFTVTTAVTGLPVPPPDTMSNISLKRTFVGMESVTVPAGTFSACKFTEESTSAGSTTTSTVWNYRAGINLKTVSGDSTTELLSAKINGTPVN